MSIFYGVALTDKRLSLAFDLIRFLAQPDAHRKTHITVRGPYKKRLSKTQIEKYEFFDIGIEQPGHFFFSRQNTVFLSCVVPGIRDAWHKPDFQDGIPHLTVYDGRDREFADDIHKILLNYPWNIWGRSTGLFELKKKSPSTIDMNIYEHEFSFFFNKNIVIEDAFGPEDAKKLSKKKRLRLINSVIQNHLVGYMTLPKLY